MRRAVPISSFAFFRCRLRAFPAPPPREQRGSEGPWQGRRGAPRSGRSPCGGEHPPAPSRWASPVPAARRALSHLAGHPPPLPGKGHICVCG